MTIEEVHRSLEHFLIDLIGTNSWTRAELNIEIQPKMLGMSGDSYNGQIRNNLRTRYSEELGNKIKWLHKHTTEGGNQKWNKAQVHLTPNDKLEIQFIWDEQWQNEIDTYNSREKELDPNYDIPKWRWEEKVESSHISEFNNTKFFDVEKSGVSGFQELLEQNAGLAFEKQMIFGELVGSSGWKLDMGKGSISFEDLEFPIQIIGSLSFSSNSWMWGWANTQSGMPDNLLIQSKQLKEIGEQKNIQELIEGQFNVDEGFEHKMGMVACGLFNSNSYYCANYGQGTLVVTIDDHRIPVVDNDKMEKVLTIFPQLINSVDLDHRNAFVNYLIDRKFELNQSKNHIEGLKNDKLIVAEFDGMNRLTSLKGRP